MEDEGMKTKQAVNPYLPSWEYVPDDVVFMVPVWHVGYNIFLLVLNGRRGDQDAVFG